MDEAEEDIWSSAGGSGTAELVVWHSVSALVDLVGGRKYRGQAGEEDIIIIIGIIVEFVWEQ